MNFSLSSLFLAVALSLSGETPPPAHGFFEGLRQTKAAVELNDAAYILIGRELLPDLMEFCEKNRTKHYLPELWDCEDTAREYQVNASKWAAKHFGGARAGMACGVVKATVGPEIFGLSDYGGIGQHALIAVCPSDGVWMLIEPRTAKMVPLLEAVYEGTIEIYSINL